MTTAAAANIDLSEFAPHPKQGRARRTFSGVAWSVLHTALPSLSAALIFFLSAAYLVPEDFGRLAIAGGLVSIALAFSPAAFGEALIQRATITPGHADAVFWLNIGVGLFYCLTLTALAGLGAAWFNEPQLAWLVPLLALKVPFELATIVPASMIIRSMRFRAIAIRTAAASAVGLVVGVGLLLSGYGLLALALSQVAFSMTTCVVTFWVADWRLGLKGRLPHLKELWTYTLFASGHRILGRLRLDHLMVGALGGTAVLGLLTFAQRFFQMLSDLAAGALGNVTHVVLSSMQDDPRKAERSFRHASFAAACVGFPAFAGAALIVDDVIALIFTDKWSEAVMATQLFCLTGLIATIGIVQGALIRSQGYPNWWFYYQALQQAGTIAVIALTLSYGASVTGVVAAIVAKTYLFWPISVVMTARILKCSPWSYLSQLRGPALATASMITALMFLPDNGGWNHVASQITLGALCYGLVLFSVCHTQVTDVFRLIRKAKTI
jgi:O-antigen/teichoic acid export membrane protein